MLRSRPPDDKIRRELVPPEHRKAAAAVEISLADSRRLAGRRVQQFHRIGAPEHAHVTERPRRKPCAVFAGKAIEEVVTPPFYDFRQLGLDATRTPGADGELFVVALKVLVAPDAAAD